LNAALTTGFATAALDGPVNGPKIKLRKAGSKIELPSKRTTVPRNRQMPIQLPAIGQLARQQPNFIRARGGISRSGGRDSGTARHKNLGIVRFPATTQLFFALHGLPGRTISKTFRPSGEKMLCQRAMSDL
jgi:hypothetical protein